LCTDVCTDVCMDKYDELSYILHMLTG